MMSLDLIIVTIFNFLTHFSKCAVMAVIEIISVFENEFLPK